MARAGRAHNGTLETSGHSLLPTSELFLKTFLKTPPKGQDHPPHHSTRVLPLQDVYSLSWRSVGRCSQRRGLWESGRPGRGPISCKETQDGAAHHSSQLTLPNCTWDPWLGIVTTIMSQSRSEPEGHEPLMSTPVLEALQGTLKGRGASHLSLKERPRGSQGTAFTTHSSSAHCETASRLQLSHQLHKTHFIGGVTVLTQTTS